MANTNQIMPFATGAQARVLSPDAYAALAARVNGFVAGPADETQLNTVWRQTSFVAAMVAQFTADRAAVDVLDNGDITTFENNFAQAVAAVAAGQVPSLPSSSYWHTGIDVSGSTQSLIADVVPSIASYAVGNVYALRTAHSATGATTANLDGIGVRNVVRADGSPIQAGDWISGEVIFLADDGANLRLYGAKSSLAPARNLTSYRVAGSYAFIVPAGVYWLYVEIVGAGGGGAGSGNQATWSCGGGGSGGYAAGWIPVSPGQAIPLIVGAKGLGSPYSTSALGGQGGTTSFGAYLTATGGLGGNGGTTNCGGGGPGQGYGGQKTFPGGSGGDGNPFNALIQGGNGGASAFGGGGRTATFNGGSASSNVSLNASAPGSGGGGIWSNSFSANELGGNGADGAVFIQY